MTNSSVGNTQTKYTSASGFELFPIIFLMGMFYLNFLPRLIMAPLMVTIEQELHIGHDDSGGFFLLISAGYCILLFFSGFISSRISHRKTIILSICASGFVLILISFSNSLWLIRAELFLLGLTLGPYFPSGLATIPTLVPAKHQGKAISIHELSPSLSFVTAPIIAEIFLHIWSWRGLLAVVGIVSMIAAFLFSRYGKGGQFNGEPPTFKNLGLLIKDRSFLIMSFLFVLGMGAGIGLYTMMPLYLVSERMFDRELANTLMSLSRIPGLVTVLIAGFALDKLGLKRTLIIVLVVTGILTIALGTLPNQGIVPVLFLQYMVSVCFFPAGWMAITLIGHPSARNVAISLAVPISYIFGGGLVPAGIGFSGEHGSFAFAIILFGVLMIIGGLLSKLLKLRSL
ncbi:MFS transporter [Thermodesulfobacteriota bacterium]